jgi:hypothetical protein
VKPGFAEIFYAYPVLPALHSYPIINTNGGFMKKLMLMTAIAFLAGGTIFAQAWSGVSQKITVTGTLQLQNGQIVLASGNTVYFVPTLIRYIGFIDGLKEGAGVSIEGYASGNYLEPSKVTINGKPYDFSANIQTQGWGNYAHCGYGSYASGGYGCGGYGYRGGRW